MTTYQIHNNAQLARMLDRYNPRHWQPPGAHTHSFFPHLSSMPCIGQRRGLRKSRHPYSTGATFFPQEKDQLHRTDHNSGKLTNRGPFVSLRPGTQLP